MKSVIKYLFLGVVVSLYYFSFSFTFLPEFINTKLIFAVLGILVSGYRLVQQGGVKGNKVILYATIIAVVFSILGFISMDINNSSDTSYATYIVSFSVWLFAGYFVVFCLKQGHEKIDFKLLTYYLVSVCVIQCCMALIIDNNLIVKVAVDRYIEQGQVFLNDVNRLYGLGASLDNAGVRFSIVLLMLSAVLLDKAVQLNIFLTISLFFSFIIILVVGSVISRTTSIGGLLALTYLLVGSSFFRLTLSSKVIRLYIIIIFSILIGVLVASYLYNTNAIFYDYLRFAFEGFFNWAEKGEWSTSSTDRLNSVMWIWPEATDMRTWLIGKATFDNWHAVGTDIGYCRFVFYNGLLGLITFSLFFVYNAWACNRLMPGYKLFFCFLLSLSFIIWLKVATDLFIIYALFYNLALTPYQKTEINKYAKEKLAIS